MPNTYIITITELGTAAEGTIIRDNDIEHYRRRVEVSNIQSVIEALDRSIKEIPLARKTRSDKGKSKSPSTTPAQA